MGLKNAKQLSSELGKFCPTGHSVGKGGYRRSSDWLDFDMSGGSIAAGSSLIALG